MKKILILASAMILSLPLMASAPNAPSLFFALASTNHLDPAIGKFDPSRGWVPSTDFYDPPQPRDVFTIFGMNGFLGHVKIMSSRRALPEETFSSWAPEISGWNWGEQPQALAISGRLPPSPPQAQALALDNPDAEKIAADYLRSKGLDVAKPLLTQVYKADFGPTLGTGLLICAHSDEKALRVDQAANVYAVALLAVTEKGKPVTYALGSQTSFKPAGRTRQEHAALNGTRDFFRLVAFMDVNGDGLPEVTMYRSEALATVVELYQWTGKKPVRVLFEYRPLHLI